MAGRCLKWSVGRDGVRRCRQRSQGGLSGLSGLTAGTLKASLKSVQGTLVTGAIAAGGAIITDEVYDKIGEQLGLTGYQRDAAKIATGIALGIVIGKVLGKPRLAAAFAIGPIVAGGINIFNSLMTGAHGTAGLGLVAVEPPLQLPAYAGLESGLGTVQVGPGVPGWMYEGQQPAWALGAA